MSITNFLNTSAAPATRVPLPAPDYRETSLVDAIERFIAGRDELWIVLSHTAPGQISADDLHRLAVANRHCLAMIAITSGPTTPVLSAQRATSELQRCRICTTFIEQADLEVRAMVRICDEVAA